VAGIVLFAEYVPSGTLDVARVAAFVAGAALLALPPSCAGVMVEAAT
jgi:hypothetical protein